MFRNVVYVTEDYSFRVVDGILKFHYWLPYVKRELSEGMFIHVWAVFTVMNKIEYQVH